MASRHFPAQSHTVSRSESGALHEGPNSVRRDELALGQGAPGALGVDPGDDRAVPGDDPHGRGDPSGESPQGRAVAGRGSGQSDARRRHCVSPLGSGCSDQEDRGVRRQPSAGCPFQET